MQNEFYRIRYTPQLSNPIWKKQEDPPSHEESPDGIWLLNDLRYILDVNKKAFPNLPSYYFKDHYEFQLLTDLFRQPIQILEMPEFIEVFAFQELQETLNVMISDCRDTVNLSSLPLVQTKFVEHLKDLGFTDYLTYPVRVYYINKFEDQFDMNVSIYKNGYYIGQARPTRTELEKQFKFDDHRFVVLQLTQPPLELFKIQNEDWIEKPNSELEFRNNLDSLELPVLFRVKYKLLDLFCNTKLQSILEKYSSLSLISSLELFQDIRGNPWTIST